MLFIAQCRGHLITRALQKAFGIQGGASLADSNMSFINLTVSCLVLESISEASSPDSVEPLVTLRTAVGPSPVTVIEELHSHQPKINNGSGGGSGSSGNVSMLDRDQSNSQPHLNTQQNQQSANSLSNQSTISLQAIVQLGASESDLGDRYSSEPCVQVMNDVNDENQGRDGEGVMRGIAGSSSWRNITGSDDSFARSNHELGKAPFYRHRLTRHHFCIVILRVGHER